MAKTSSGTSPVNPRGRSISGAAAATTAPAATQRSCWRSTPREVRKRRTRQTAATGTQANSIPQPIQWMVSATAPAVPCSGNGLATG